MTRFISSLLASDVFKFMAGCTGRKGQPSSVTAAEYAAYDAVITSLYLSRLTRLVILKNQTVPWVQPGASLDIQVHRVRGQVRTAVKMDTLVDYNAKNIRSYQLEAAFALDVPCVLVGEAELHEILGKEDGWSEFYRIYPDSSGIIDFSRVGFSTQMDQALVYTSWRRFYLSGSGKLVSLTKKGGVWAVDRTGQVWIS